MLWPDFGCQMTLFFKTMDKGCLMLKSQFSQKTWYFSENPFVSGNVAEKQVNVS